jgi:outer membrane protein OmpA-like peptidoglycan-associated protein
MISARNILVYFLSLTLVFGGCKSKKKMSNTTKGAAIGAAAGAAVGAGVGKLAKDHTLLGAIIGAGVGGVAGGLIGRYMDKQAAEIKKDVEGAKVERVGEGIKITFESGILFNVASWDLRPAAKDNITKLAEVLMKYPDTDVLIEGHTDNTGDSEYNQSLSEKRARSVENYVKGMGIKGSRITSVGHGEGQPIDDNNSETGRQKNRRVEIAIMANEKLKKAAKDGNL